MEPGEAAVAPCDPYPSAVPMTADDRMGALRAIDRIGAKQFGVFSRAQAAAEGVSLRMMARRRSEGEWLAVLPGIYRFASVTVTYRQRAMAAALWSGPDGLVSRESAAVLWGLEGIGRGGPIHITVPDSRRLRHPQVFVHRSRDLIPADHATVGPIPVTSALRAVLDMAATLNPVDLEVVIEAGLRRGLFTKGQLRWRSAARRGPGIAGSAAVADLVDRHGLGLTGSGWEVRVAAILVAAGLPSPIRQLPVSTSLGTRTVDLAYPGPPVVAFEYDSDQWHSTVRQRHDDAARRNALRVAGTVVVEVTPRLVRDPVALAAMARAALADGVTTRS